MQTDRSTRALLIQQDGKILIAGFFGEVNGVPMPRIARLNSDGTTRSLFQPGGWDRTNITFARSRGIGGKYLRWGRVLRIQNGIPRLGLVKLSPTGWVVLRLIPVAGGGPTGLHLGDDTTGQ